MRAFCSVLALFVVTVVAPESSNAQGLSNHAQISHAPLISLQVPIGDRKVNISRIAQTKMVLAGMGGVASGALLTVASQFVLVVLTDNYDMADDKWLYVIGAVALPVSTAYAVHNSQVNQPYTSKFSCTLKGSYLGFAGGILLAGPTGATSILAGPAYMAKRSYQRRAYYKDGVTETGQTNG